MRKTRKSFSEEFKAKVALEAIKGEKSLAEIASHYEVHPNQVTQWKKRIEEAIHLLFSRRGDRHVQEKDELIDELYRQIGQLKVELDWVKKNLAGSFEDKRHWVEADHPRLSIAQQCELLGLSRASWYYEPGGESAENLWYMRLIDEEYTRHPFYGLRRLCQWLKRQGYGVNRKRVSRLMWSLGLAAIYPRPRLSAPEAAPKKYPYWLRNLAIERPDQVWCIDITYIRLRGGFLYLAAVMDWYSRYILSWQLSSSLEGGFCVEVLEEALRRGRPEIFNSNQGVQFTAREFTGRLEKEQVRISRGRERTSLRQHHDRTALAFREIRGGVPERLRELPRLPRRIKGVFRVLQRATPASTFELSNPAGGVS